MDNTVSILCVDDDPDILSSLKRQLYSKYNVLTAENGEQGLEILKQNGPISVVLSDMRMPKMNGAAFLAKVKESSPHTMRLLLTGQSDVDSAIDAINDGRIYRFLMKPCEQEELIDVLDSAVLENQMLELEDNLLQKTLYTSAGLMDVILHAIQPIGHRIVSRQQEYIVYMADKLALSGKQQLESAANLAQLGCLNLPDDIIQKIYRYIPLDKDEQDIFTKHMIAGWNLVIRVADMKIIFAIMTGLKESYSQAIDLSVPLNMERIDKVGVQILKIAIDLDRYISAHGDIQNALQAMQDSELYYPELLNLLSDYSAHRTIH